MSEKRKIVGRCPRCHHVVVFLPTWTRGFASMTLRCTLIHPGGQQCKGKVALVRGGAVVRALRMMRYDSDGVPEEYPSKALVESLLGEPDDDLRDT